MSKRFWLLKTEPDCYAWSDLVRDGWTVWDGVTNNVALKYLREMQPGDEALIYHTGDERRAVGRAEVISAPYPDPQQNDPRMVVVNVRPLAPLPRPVTLADIKADPAFADCALVRQSRLSVAPVTEAQWQRLLAMAGVDSGER
ncbi:MAG: EVE domain-containing protein [Roseiflexus sp.]|nr:EVE domain-containing protein [Roseiflexus sp.]MCS7289689.1 EVE domain-containing protein [Roseiflexus sp.]MDW8148716.1 EVE domain-containing protein [Roseiflexaceae bacterium]MDW8232381.1 EVE domain-containing protein [Roseiflexaceae bacterium]